MHFCLNWSLIGILASSEIGQGQKFQPGLLKISEV
ncbi:hypothetical protein WP1_035 [Pseudomonas phage WP1]